MRIGTAARLAFLLDEWGEARFRAEVEARLAVRLLPGGIDARKTAIKDHIGIYRQTQPGLNYVGLKVTVGRITAADLKKVTAVAERYGNGEMRLSPAQAIIIPNVPDRLVGDLAEDPV